MQVDIQRLMEESIEEKRKIFGVFLKPIIEKLKEGKRDFHLFSLRDFAKSEYKLEEIVRQICLCKGMIIFNLEIFKPDVELSRIIIAREDKNLLVRLKPRPSKDKGIDLPWVSW